MKLNDVTFSYGEKPVLQNFTLILPDTGVTALTAPSGKGKTTVLRLLAGLEKPNSGTVEAPDKADISVMFQENRLLPGLSAARQIEAVLPKGSCADKWLEAVELLDSAGMKPEELSGGMQRRVSLARCLANGQNKQLILLDEPFTGVDPERAARIMRFIRALGVPVIFTAHDSESLSLSDKVISL